MFILLHSVIAIIFKVTFTFYVILVKTVFFLFFFICKNGNAHLDTVVFINAKRTMVQILRGINEHSDRISFTTVRC